VRYRSVMQDGRVRVVVSGGTGVIGRAAVRSLVAAGHDVDVLSRSADNTALIEDLGARPRTGDLFDRASLEQLFVAADAVVNLASHVPVGYAAAWPTAWRQNDALRTEAVANVVAAARAAGVRRLVQQSVSYVYADKGDGWIREQDPIEITPATEPPAVGESHVLDFGSSSRAGVVLRFGTIVGDDPMTRFTLKAAACGRPVGLGRADQWSHLVHTDDLGPAVVAALHAPRGVYNVGAEPVLRGELVDGYAKAVGADSGAFMGPVLRRLAGPRIEPLTRSLRVCSEYFSAQTGWMPRRPTFDPAWFDVATQPAAAAR
jgi:nucleoside-diphosphate-sugar epimerase